MFGCICAGRPVQTNLQSLSPTQHLFNLPSPSTINHLVVFLLPDTHLPPTHVATVHLKLPSSPGFQLLGAISAGKPSAIFRTRHLAQLANSNNMNPGQEQEAILGISIEEVAVAEAQLSTLANQGAAGRDNGSTLRLARKIIENAFNFLSSFAEPAPGGEVVRIKAFQDWWKKFEKKVEMDPAFLEREG
ncbi:DUF775-domain-containing protein [Ascodesmis nigricans]|uniref:DUF775-domain-containing protein n=1 Tax=Ascodesmis nigricans TaxID=341454 RepID=A0A4S2N376_9PEZI|nr:DUF775-domain-containing protein [Ascodesmis nigricans]